MIKKFFITLLIGIIFIIIAPLLIGGLGTGVNQSTNSTNSSEDLHKYNTKTSDIVFNNNNGNPNIKVYITKEKKIQELNLEEYVRGVVSAEMPAEFNIEALKAQAVAARTFAAAHMEAFGGKKYPKAKGADVTDTVDCQVYIDKAASLKKIPEQYWNKVIEAVQDTKGQVLTYKGKLVMEPYYFATSSGKTEDSVQVFGSEEPYLKSVSSPGEEQAPKYKSQVSMSYNKFLNIIKSEYPDSNLNALNIRSQVKILSRLAGGSVDNIKIGNVTISGIKFRSYFGLNSANFNITFHIMNIEIDCCGYGHDVGMSQWGANAMAKLGSNYRNILSHYYQGVSVQNIN